MKKVVWNQCRRSDSDSENLGSNPSPPANQSRLPLRIAGGRTNRAVPRHSWGPVSVSIHGMRTFDADIGSCLQGLFSTHGFCTCGEAESACNDRLCSGRNCNTAGVGSSCSRRGDRGRSECPGRRCCSIDGLRPTMASTLFILILRIRNADAVRPKRTAQDKGAGAGSVRGVADLRRSIPRYRGQGKQVVGSALRKLHSDRIC